MFFKKDKKIIRNIMGQEKLNALEMLTTEKKLVQLIPDFDIK